MQAPGGCCRPPKNSPRALPFLLPRERGGGEEQRGVSALHSVISTNSGFSGEGGGVPSPPLPRPLSSPLALPLQRGEEAALRCEINYGPSPLSITEESAFPTERRNNQKAFNLGGTSDRGAHNATRGLPCFWPPVSYANVELPPSYHYGFIAPFFFFFFNVIIVLGF